MKDQHAVTDRRAIQTLIGRLRRQRLFRNWTQAEMARRVRLSRRAYQDIERGYGNVTLVNLVRILGTLGLAERLAELIPEPNPPASLAEVMKAVRVRARRTPKRKSPP